MTSPAPDVHRSIQRSNGTQNVAKKNARTICKTKKRLQEQNITHVSESGDGASGCFSERYLHIRTRSGRATHRRVRSECAMTLASHRRVAASRARVARAACAV
ncbi:unnamed protein product [Danaus chrysippus]|uniref:(African queen) hypothetical protein n=1 Tax=Danaus chrysippus TaxID=151541 RepID=A0A8J2R7R6_9NEOP|nr:unnamed protein product [Danaus chrysippus]